MDRRHRSRSPSQRAPVQGHPDREGPWRSTARRPMFAEPLHVGQPNIGNHERFLQRAARDSRSRLALRTTGPSPRNSSSKIADISRRQALRLRCATGPSPGDRHARIWNLKGEVIVPSYTFIATAHALQWQEITPIFADIDPATHNLDPAAVRRMSHAADHRNRRCPSMGSRSPLSRNSRPRPAEQQPAADV